MSIQQGTETVAASKLISEELAKTFGKDSFQILSVDYVGPKVGRELRWKGTQAMLYSLIGILVYVAFRFEFRYALGAVFALFHDATICAGFYNVIQHDWSLAIIAALLTVIGYSNNDTIVVYARIRETVGRTRRGTLHEIINVSVNETLSRTLLTSFVTFVSLIFLYFFGAGILRDFSLVLLVGIIVGTYSSIYIASSFVLLYDDVRGKKSVQQEKMKK
jgi:preprotein translocase subunit SecF